MPITLDTPTTSTLPHVVAALRGWQRTGAPVQLHPGDLGWHYRFGAATTAAAVRTWSRDGTILATGLLDGPGLIRLAIAPEAALDDELAQHITADLTQPERGVLPAGDVSVEARFGPRLRELLTADGWGTGEAWTPLELLLDAPLPEHDLRVVVTTREYAEVRAAVHRASFDRSTFDAAAWQAMADGPAYRDARCLVGYDERGVAVAAATVWSAGPGRPGLLEPLGAHRDHRGRGHGTAITLGAAAVLRELGSSSATVCTPSTNTVGVAAYRSAGLRELTAVHDLHRSAAHR